jgi:hypothetical protein
MVKRASLFSTKPAAVTASALPDEAPANDRPDRAGKRLLGAHIPETAYRQFRILAAEKGIANNELLREAINDLFAKYGKQQIA